VARQALRQATALEAIVAKLPYFLPEAQAVAATAATHLAEMEVTAASVPVEEAVVLVVPQVAVALVEKVAKAWF
jgi:hypothetical protein